MAFKVCLIGGSHDGRFITLKHGNAVLIGDEKWERPAKPKKLTRNIECWPLVQIDGQATEQKHFPT